MIRVFVFNHHNVCEDIWDDTSEEAAKEKLKSYKSATGGPFYWHLTRVLDEGEVWRY